MSLLNYLAYGSNMLNQRLLERVPSSRFVETIRLSGYTLNFSVRGIDGSGKCNMLYTGKQNDLVYAAVYEMKTREKPLLDQFEGDSYAVEELEVQGESSKHNVFAYIGKPNYLDHNLKPYIWYRDIVALGASSRSFPSDYVESIAKTAAIVDPDQTRQTEHERIMQINQTEKRDI